MSETTSTSKNKLSTTPSWVMVGFILGALFATGVQHEIERRGERKTDAAPAAAPATAAAGPAGLQPEPPVKSQSSLVAVENVFAQYNQHAVWRNDLTEIAIWNADTNRFSECFEVMRSGDCFYYRSIPGLTRPVIRPNPAPDLPLRYTEPEDEQLKRLQQQSIWLPPSTDPDR